MKKKFEYFLNAIHYCLYLEEKWSTRIIEKCVLRLFHGLSILFNFESFYQRKMEERLKNRDLQEFMYGKTWGESIGFANHWFGYIYSGYPGFLSFTLLGAVDEMCNHHLNAITVILILLIPIGLCYIPAYRAVFTKDQLIRIYHTGNGQCLRKYAGHSIAKQVVVHQEIPLIAASDGFRHLETRNYYEKTAGGRKMGWWYENKYEPKGHVIDGDILDIAFNVRNQQLVAILANGKIMFCNDKYCKYQDSLQIITALNVDAYDFSECICSKEIKELLRRNGALVN